MIRILQIVDSSAIGGKEKMVISIANSIAKNEDFESYVCLTTKEGPLLCELDDNVKFISLDKKFSLDLIAIFKLVGFIKDNKIDLIHAHSSSFFTAVLCKIFVKVNIIWHDHNGKRSQMSFVPKNILRIFSFAFSFVIVVSNKLEVWAGNNLLIPKEKILYLANFANENESKDEIELPGIKGKRIVCVANLRDPKNHILLLKSFNKIVEKFNDWHLLLVGNDYHDDYSNELKDYINKSSIKDNIHILGVRTDIGDILANSNIGVLSSSSEGLPVSLLEYGMSKLAVLITDVGYCKQVLKNGNLGLVSPNIEVNSYSKELEHLLESSELRNKLALGFYAHVMQNYSEEAIMKQLAQVYKEIT